jgi:hypothetical protein
MKMISEKRTDCVPGNPIPRRRGIGTAGQLRRSQIYVAASQRSFSSTIPGLKVSPALKGSGNRSIACLGSVGLLIELMITQTLKLPVKPFIWRAHFKIGRRNTKMAGDEMLNL